MENKKVLVTGCAGFIGSHVTEKLLSLGFEVTGIDAMTDYYDPVLKRENIKSALQNEKFSFIHDDLLTSKITERIDRFDYIFHLAAQPGVRTSWGRLFNTYVENNILTTQRLLESVIESKRLKKFFFASSSSVYGEISKEKVTEGDHVKPFSPYGVTKLAAENLCELYRNNYNVPTVSLRFFTVYGPRQRPDMAFSRLIRSAITGKSFTVFGDGNQLRDYTYISDVVEGVILAAFKKNVFGIYNIAGGSVISLNEVIQIVKEITGKKLEINRELTQKGDVRLTSADILKAHGHFGFYPKIYISLGIKAQYESYLTNG